MHWLEAVIGTAIAVVGVLYTVIKLNNNRNPPHQERNDAPGRSTRVVREGETNPVLCETCERPKVGDATTWIEFECGHWYHQNCLNLFATTHCITCELQAAQRVADGS